MDLVNTSSSGLSLMIGFSSSWISSLLGSKTSIFGSTAFPSFISVASFGSLLLFCCKVLFVARSDFCVLTSLFCTAKFVSGCSSSKTDVWVESTSKEFFPKVSVPEVA